MPGRAERQTLLFSATASDMIQGLAETFMHDRVTVYIGIVGGANVDVRQEFVDVTLKQKTEVLVDLLQPSVKDSTKKSLVFLSQRLSVDWLRSHLETHGIKSVAIHA